MIECPLDHPQLPVLFDPHVPNNAPLWAVLLGRHAGRALVDEMPHPKQCVLRTEAALTYASRQVSQEFLIEAVNHFKRWGLPGLFTPREIHLHPKVTSTYPGWNSMISSLTRRSLRISVADCPVGI